MYFVFLVLQLVCIMTMLYMSTIAIYPIVSAYFTRTMIIVPQISPDEMNMAVRRWIEKSEKIFAQAGIQMKPDMIVLCVCLWAAGFSAGTAVFKNMAAGVLTGTIAGTVPIQILLHYQITVYGRILEQTGVAARLFSAEYADTAHTFRAIGKIADRISYPVGGYFETAYREYVAGKDQEEILLRLGRRLRSEYGMMFVQLLRISLDDESVKPLLTSLSMRITDQQQLMAKERREVGADRIVSIVLNLLIFPAYWVVNAYVSNVGLFFTETLTGKFIIITCLLSILIAMLLDIIATKGVLN